MVCEASLAVAMFHFNEPNRGLDDSYHDIMRQGFYGLVVFFVISGYCVTRARLRTGLSVFLRRRLLRIYPPYCASLLLVCFVGLLIALRYGLHNHRFLPDAPHVWLLNFFCLAGPMTGVLTMNEVSWTLTYEVALYLIVGLILPFGRGRGVAAICAVGFFWHPFPLDFWGPFALGIALACWPALRLSAVLGAVLAFRSHRWVEKPAHAFPEGARKLAASGAQRVRRASQSVANVASKAKWSKPARIVRRKTDCR